MAEAAVGPEVLYQTRIIVNPKNAFSLKPVATLKVMRDGLYVESDPPLSIPFASIRSAKVRQLTDGVIEHGDRVTCIRGASIWTGAWEAPKIIQVVNNVKAKGSVLADSEETKKQFGAIRNYWAVFVVGAVGMSGGAIGGAWGALFGMLAQSVINKKPQRSIAFKVLTCIVAIFCAIIAYLVTVIVLAQIFPGLLRR